MNNHAKNPKPKLDPTIRKIANFYGFNISYKDNGNYWVIISGHGNSWFFWDSNSSLEDFLRELRLYFKGQGAYEEEDIKLDNLPPKRVW